MSLDGGNKLCTLHFAKNKHDGKNPCICNKAVFGILNINIQNVIKHNEASNKANILSWQTEVSDKL
jgi:hypothetical protein